MVGSTSVHLHLFVRAEVREHQMSFTNTCQVLELHLAVWASASSQYTSQKKRADTVTCFPSRQLGGRTCIIHGKINTMIDLPHLCRGLAKLGAVLHEWAAASYHPAFSTQQLGELLFVLRKVPFTGGRNWFIQAVRGSSKKFPRVRIKVHYHCLQSSDGCHTNHLSQLSPDDITVSFVTVSLLKSASR